MIVVLLGKPCSGKGTISKKLINQYGYHHISTGDILRKNNLTNHDGKLASDELVCSLVGEDILKHENVILDGFPRTINQYDYLLNFLAENNLEIGIYIHMNISDAEVYNRMNKRKIEENRLDDNDDALKIRLSEFQKHTLPMINKIGKQPQINIGEESSIADYDLILSLYF